MTFLSACARDDAPPPADAAPPSADAVPAAADAPAVLFRDVSDAAGIDFVHDRGGTGRKYMPEIMGSGGCALDYDGDGWSDLYFVQSGPFPDGGETGATAAVTPGNRLYRNRGDGTFEDVTTRAGAGGAGYGMGAVAGDYDGDGWSDLYLVNFGPDVLLRNRGDGRFEDVTRAAGITGDRWGSSAVFFDADLDGDLDLYVVGYLDFTVAKHVDCGTPSRGILSYCHPDVYAFAPDVFYRNRGDGTFVEATAAVGMIDADGKGLGAVAADLDGDGWPDLYVANDSTPNFLYRNRGDGTFEEMGLLLGVGYNEDGLTEAGMGTAVGDVDGDGRLDLFVTNLDHESNALYLGGPDFFTYASREAGLAAGSFLPVGFGTELQDLDNDGDVDLAVVNGHIIDNVELVDDAQSFRQPGQVFLNDGGGRFEALPAARVGDLATPRVGRGTVVLDHDRDGRLDLAVTANGDRARLFTNEHRPAGRWIVFELAGARAVGAVVKVETGGRRQLRVVTAGSSYQTGTEPRLHFGLGDAARVDRVEVRRPGGVARVYRGLPAGRSYRVE